MPLLLQHALRTIQFCFLPASYMQLAHDLDTALFLASPWFSGSFNSKINPWRYLSQRKDHRATAEPRVPYPGTQHSFLAATIVPVHLQSSPMPRLETLRLSKKLLVRLTSPLML